MSIEFCLSGIATQLAGEESRRLLGGSLHNGQSPAHKLNRRDHNRFHEKGLPDGAHPAGLV
jgi:hypothetical protein